MSRSGARQQPNPHRFAAFLADRLGGALWVGSCDEPPAARDVLLVRRAELRRLPGTHVERAGATVVVGERSAEPQRELPALRSELLTLGLEPEFLGVARWRGRAEEPDIPVAVLRGSRAPIVERAPAGFRVVALVMTYNEADVIDHTIGHLADHGVETYVVDNWSTDDTLDRARAWNGRGLVGWERFPSGGRTPTWRLRALLERFEELSSSLDADWFIRNDADEFREPPWPGVRLIDAIHYAEQMGFSAVNHTLLNFALTAEDLPARGRPTDAQRWFAPGNVADRTQVNAWRRHPGRVALAWSGGHVVRFEGRRIFPYNFLLRHHPTRSLDQAARKVFQERLPRFDAEERMGGWHSHYDGLGAADDLVVATAGLIHFGDDFAERYLIERLSGIGFGVDLDPPGLKHVIARLLIRVRLWETAQTLARRLRPR